MSETISEEQEYAKRMFRQTGQLPPSNEGDTQYGLRHRTGELKEVGDNTRWHRIITISTETGDLDKPEDPKDPDLSARFPLAEQMDVADRTFARDLQKYTALRRSEREQIAELREKRLKIVAIARSQQIQYQHEKAQMQELEEWQTKVKESGDFRKALGDPSIPESEILAMAAQMPESAVVDYVQRTGDIELLVRDERMTPETILGVIENMKNELPKE